MNAARPRRLLIISYLFPPAGGVAVQRALSLAKYLPGCGYVVHVLRAGNASAPVEDPGLLRHVPATVTVHTAFTPELPFRFRQRVWGWLSRSKQPTTSSAPQASGGLKQWARRLVRRILCPEPEVLWVPFALRKARRIVRQNKIEAVLVTAPPFSAFLVGNALKREFPALKLISDFRDSWLQFYSATFDFQQSDHIRRRSAEIERETVERSDYVVTVTHSIRSELRTRYPGQPDEKFVYIPNGYDPEVFDNFQPRKHGGEKIVVTHLGTVYEASSPRSFLDALAAMPEQVRAAFEVRFIGRVTEQERRALEFYGSLVRMSGFMPQTEALRQLEETDYALVVMTDAASLTGKLLEYLATRKPVLAISPNGGEVERVLRETNCGWCADPNDRDAIQAMISLAYDRARSGSAALEPNLAAVREYERPRQVAQFARLMAAGEMENAKVEVLQ
ncbi:MAG TPA: glycosyltransferase [Bryobacteraceae bacterium]|nr:glycosyltransferase [Bryobacteraceae bacterium]